MSKPCNMCGEPCIGPEQCGALGIVDHVITGGYSSTPGNGDGALDDGTSYTFSLCEFCIDWLFTQFKTPPIVTDVFDFTRVEPFRPALQRVKEDDWRRFKQRFYDEYDRRSAARRRGRA